MKTITVLLAAIVSSMVLSACASRPTDWRSVSVRLRQGMNEEQAVAAIGYAPDSADVVRCGVERGAGWECRRLSFNSSGLAEQHPLIVYETNYGGVWRVESWNTP